MNETQKAASPSLLIPSLGGIYRCGSEFTYPMIRFVAGAMLVPDGWMKLIGGGVEGNEFD
jgi:hypothetical protein